MINRRKEKTPSIWRTMASACLSLLIVGSARAQAPVFTNVTSSAQLSNTLRNPGLAWGDYNRDGRQDIFITAWTLVGGAPINKLWRNNGNGTFTNTASSANVAGFNNFTSSAAWGDFNNDGRLDIFVTNFPRDEQDFLYQNNGSSFSILLPNTVKGNPLWSAWGDYNLDGNLDLAIARFNGSNLLFRNNGNGTFTDVSVAAKINDVRDSERVTWVDYDNDGLPDLYIVNIYQENRLLRNKGDGTFEDVTYSSGVGSAGIGRHSAWADYDLDGDMDLYVANIGQNILFQNNGNGTFSRVAGQADQTGGAWVSWMAGWSDYNLDGATDLFVASGAESQSGERSTLFSNNGNGTFTDVTAAPFSTPDSSSGAAWADYDNDGDPDLYLLSYGEDALYRNDTTPNVGQSFLKIIPFRFGKGSASIDSSAADGIGVKIWVYDAGATTIRGYQEIISGPDALEAIFGLPTAGTYDIKVQFTSRSGSPAGAVIIDKNDNATKYGAVTLPRTVTVKEIENSFFP
jgi:hypothetical protein